MLRVPVYQPGQVASSALPAPTAQAEPSGLEALGAGLASLGADAQAVYLERKAQDDQTAVFNGYAAARKAADDFESAWSQMDGPAAIAAAGRIVPDFDATLTKIRAGLTPDQQRGFDMRTLDLRESLRVNVEKRSGRLRLDGATAALGNVVQTETDGLRRQVARDGLAFRPSATATYRPGEAPPMTLDKGAIEARWASIESAIKAHGAAYRAQLPTDQATWERLALEDARSDLTENVVNGLLERGDDVAAKAYYDEMRETLAIEDPEGRHVRDQVTRDVERAYHAGEVERVSATAFARHKNATGTWSEREAAMMEDIADTKDEDIRKDAREAAKALVAGAQSDEQATWRDKAAEFDDALRKGTMTGAQIEKDPEFGALPADMQRGLMLEANRETRGDYARTDAVIYDHLTTTARDNPAGLVDEDIDQYERLGQLNASDAAAFRSKRASVAEALEKGESARASGFISYDTVVANAAHAIHPGQGDEAKKNRGQFERDLNDAVVAWQVASGKQATPEQVQDIADAYTANRMFSVPASGRNWFGRMFGIEYDADVRISDILPSADLDDAVFALKSEGLEVNAENLAAYARMWQEDQRGR